MESRVQNPWLGKKGSPLCGLYLAFYIMFPLVSPNLVNKSYSLFIIDMPFSAFLTIPFPIMSYLSSLYV